MHLITMLSPSAGLPMPVNIIAVLCNCGVRFAWPSNISLAQCPGCGRAELWHKVEPRGAGSVWDQPVMTR